jgi:hypothetical protein
MTELQFCVAPRKDGRPCRGLGTIFDPARNGMVCDAHQPGGPGSLSLKVGSRLAVIHQQATLAERREALLRSLSDEGLSNTLKDLHKFRDGGESLRPKTRKLLEEILLEDTRRKLARKRGGKL